MLKMRRVGSQSIARGRVILDTPYLTTTAIFAGDKEKVVVKLDKRKLKEVWRKNTKLQVRGGHGEVILLAYYDEAQAWNPDGDMLWKRKVPSYFVAREDRLYVMESGLEVVDLTTGKACDHFKECPEGYPALLHDGVLFVRNPEKSDPLRAFHLGERRVKWERNPGEEIKARYGIDGQGLSLAASVPGRFVAARAGHLFGMSVTDGEILWMAPVNVPYHWPQAKDGRIYVWTTAPVTVSQKTTFDLSSGQVSRERSQPAGGENRFVIVDEVTGEIVSDRPLGPYGAPFQRFQEPMRGTLCKRHIAFTTQAGLIALFRLSDGELVWHHEYRDELFYPVFEGNRLYTPCADGSLVVFEAEGGEL